MSESYRRIYSSCVPRNQGMNQFHIKRNCFNGEAVFAFNGGAVSLDSQGCKPLVGIPTTNRKSRSDGIGSSRVSVVAMNHRSPPIAKTVNATAPPFPIQPGTISRGSHPWLSNTIAPRFNTIAPRFKCAAPRFRPNTISRPRRKKGTQLVSSSLLVPGD